MQKKFEIFIILFFISLNLFSQDKKNITFFISNKEISFEDSLIIERLFDYAKNYFLNNEKNLNYYLILENIDQSNIKQIANFVLTNSIDCYLWVNSKNDKGQYLDINIKLFSGVQENIFEINYKEKIESLQKDKIGDFTKVLDEILLRIRSVKSKTQKNLLFNKKNEFKHDFPFVNISLSAISLKFYFDYRTSLKIFSFFPVEFRLTFYPLKYMETGAFIKFDYNNMIYKYLDRYKEYQYFDSVFNLTYGLYLGFSYFNDNFHYSFGGQFYNLYYDLTNTKFKKPDTFQAYFAPQFSMYNKIDIKIFKFINYSIFINLKTTPLFYTDGDYFFSKIFSYDFVVLEFSLVGISITF